MRCSRCEQDRPVDQFPWNNKSKGKRLKWCKECKSEYDRNRYRSDGYKNKTRIQKKEIRRRNSKFICGYLSDKSCVDCGENRIPCLQFDHRGGKRHNVSDMLSFSVVAIEEEIAKCEIRCANCHAIRTAEEQGWHKSG